MLAFVLLGIIQRKYFWFFVLFPLSSGKVKPQHKQTRAGSQPHFVPLCVVSWSEGVSVTSAGIWLLWFTAKQNSQQLHPLDDFEFAHVTYLTWQNTKPKPFIVTEMHTGKNRGHAPHGFFLKIYLFYMLIWSYFKVFFFNYYFICPKL